MKIVYDFAKLYGEILMMIILQNNHKNIAQIIIFTTETLKETKIFFPQKNIL